MIIKILSSSASFAGVSYNTNKIDSGSGELMMTANFGALEGLRHLRPEDYRNYLKMVSARNKAVKNPQFHATISAKGNSYDKHQLTEIAVKWLSEMGYQDQPYLVVFHNDTGNNHIHVVSSRVGRNGKKINSAFENVRAVKCLNKLLGLDEKFSAKQDLKRALAFTFSTIPQFKMILEDQGYTIKENGQNYILFKFGSEQFQIERNVIESRISKENDHQQRRMQIRALLHKYAKMYDTSLKISPLPAGKNDQRSKVYSSEFAGFLKEKFGLVLVFHAKEGKPPYGYSIIDHPGKNVFKGSEIVPLKELLGIDKEKNDTRQHATGKFFNINHHATRADRAYYLALITAAMTNYPDFRQGLHHLKLQIREHDGELILADHHREKSLNLDQVIDKQHQVKMLELMNDTGDLMTELYHEGSSIPGIDISADIDDEAIHGRKRKKHSRANSR